MVKKENFKAIERIIQNYSNKVEYLTGCNSGLISRMEERDLQNKELIEQNKKLKNKILSIPKKQHPCCEGLVEIKWSDLQYDLQSFVAEVITDISHDGLEASEFTKVLWAYRRFFDLIEIKSETNKIIKVYVKKI